MNKNIFISIDELDIDKLDIDISEKIDIYNFILTVNFFYEKIFFGDNENKIENFLYSKMNEKEIKWFIVKTLQILIENSVNELIKNDIIAKKKNTNMWISKNLDSFHLYNLTHLNKYLFLFEKILPKTKDEDLRYKIIKANIIVSCLERVNGVFLYTKLKKNIYPSTLLENINFTKGYLVCFEPSLSVKLLNYKYNRKTFLNKPLKIEYINKDKKVINILDNTNYNSGIWIRPETFKKINFNNIKIFNNILNDTYDPTNLIEIINFLNNTKIIINHNIWEIIYKIIQNDNVQKKSLDGNTVYGDIYNINNKGNTEFFIGEDLIFSHIKSTTSLPVLMLINDQIKNTNFYYGNYKYDTRLRMYDMSWPLNYQLDHSVRNCIKLENIDNFSTIYKAFFNHPLTKKYIKKEKLFLYQKTNKIKKIRKFLNKNYGWNLSSSYEDYIKIEIFIIYLNKLTEKIKKKNDDRIVYSLNILNDFINADIIKDYEKWMDTLKIKKIPYLVSLHETFVNFSIKKFDSLYWGDASSNAIQLITLRLRSKNKKLLMLTNIMENETNFNNIYSYVTHTINNDDEKINNLIQSLNNKEFCIHDFKSIHDNDDSKYRIMPASYGMGFMKHRLNLQNTINDDPKRKLKWEILNDEDKNKISDYLWIETFKILKEMGFDLDHYKKICENIKNNENGLMYDLHTWYNDYNFPVVPINIISSKRQEYLKKINNIKQITEKTEKTEKKKKDLNKKLQLDDNLYWKRTMVKTKNNSIYMRIYHPKEEKISKTKNLTSLVPNTIHSYDSSIMALVIQIAKELNINILVIHDSIGCHILLAPLIKILFKIANIEILDRNTKKIPFPFDKKNYKLSKKDVKFYASNILKSSEFFR